MLYGRASHPPYPPPDGPDYKKIKILDQNNCSFHSMIM